jgi:general secretion pathway protein D
MLKKIVKYIIFTAMLIVILVCLAVAEETENLSFDPFASEAGLTAKSSKSESGSIVPQVEFSNNDISMAFQIISDATGWSIFPTADVSKAKVNLWAKDISAKELLDTIVNMAGFIYHRDGNIITVMTYDEYMQHYGLAKRVFKFKFADAVSIDAVIKPFLTKLGKSVVHNETNTIVLYEAKANLEYIEAVIEALDDPAEDAIIEVINLKYADSELLAEKLKQLFSEDRTKTSEVKNNSQMEKSDNTKPPVSNILSPQSQVYIQALGRTNQLIIKAYSADIKSLKQLIEKLDNYVEPITKNYQLIYIDALEVFNGLEKILNLDMANDRSKDSRDKNQGVTLITKTNSILLTGPPSVHRVMTSIVESVDKPNTYETGMIRIYKLENADVEEVGKTISELLETNSEENSAKVNFSQKTSAEPKTSSVGSFAQSEEYVPQIEVRVSVSKSTNSVVVQATARQHREIEKLIKELDKRRKQVLIKAMIVELTTTDNLNVGVDLSHAADNIAAFTSFGLSTKLDPTTGTRDITVSPGGTAAVLKPDKVHAIVQALKRDGKVRITSAPRILVNDNAVGFINSIAEEPTTQTTQGETTTITSFAGFVEAGTQFAITPHISENGYLRVEYQITLNSFGTKSTDPSVPPPRNTNSIQSEATVPGGFTIVVGGLKTVDESKDVDKVPLLGDVPILGWAFKNTKIEKQYKITYLFITPTIMENEDFADLKQVSDSALKEIEPNEVSKWIENIDANNAK